MKLPDLSFTEEELKSLQTRFRLAAESSYDDERRLKLKAIADAIKAVEWGPAPVCLDTVSRLRPTVTVIGPAVPAKGPTTPVSPTVDLTPAPAPGSSWASIFDLLTP